MANTLREKLESLEENHNRITLVTAAETIENLRVIDVKEDFAKFRQVHSRINRVVPFAQIIEIRY